MVEVTLASLHSQLVELEASRPEMPRGLDPEHPLFIAWRQAFQKHVDRKQLILSKITAASCPIELGVRQERPRVALPVPRMRMRQ